MQISIRGKAKVAKFYNLSRLEMEGVDFEDYDLESKEDVEELFEIVNDFVESGEADAIEPPLEVESADPDESHIEIGEKNYYPDEVTLKNLDIIDYLAPIQEAEEGDVYYVRTLEGDGLWDIDVDSDTIDVSELELGYLDCSILFDQYDVLREGYLDLLCDAIVPNTTSYKDVAVEVSDFVFHPVQVYGQLYVVKKDPIADVNVLQKVDFGGRMLAGADLIVDDFEEN